MSSQVPIVDGGLHITGVFRLDNAIPGRINAVNPLRYFSATILVSDDSYLPKTILIADDMFTNALSCGTSYRVSGTTINRFHQYPPVLFPDYSTLPPSLVLYPRLGDIADDIAVRSRGRVEERRFREAWQDTSLLVKHQDWDPSGLCTGYFFAEYICNKSLLDGINDSNISIGANVTIQGHVRGFSEGRDTWIIVATHITLDDT